MLHTFQEMLIHSKKKKFCRINQRNMHLEKIKELCSSIFKTLWMPNVSFCCRLAVGTEVDSRFNHAALASKGRHSPVMMLDISLLYILLLSLLSLPASPIISPSFHRHQLQVYCQAQSVGEEVLWRILQIRPQGSHCITFSYFPSRESGTQYTFFCCCCLFSWSLFSVLCYIILTLSLSLALWASAVGSVAVWSSSLLGCWCWKWVSSGRWEGERTLPPL